MSRYSGPGPFSARNTKETKRKEAKARQFVWNTLTPEEKVKKELDWHGTQPSEWLVQLLTQKYA